MLQTINGKRVKLIVAELEDGELVEIEPGAMLHNNPPAVPSAPRKRGRSRKNAAPAAAAAPAAPAAAAAAEVLTTSASTTPRKRGRPRNTPAAESAPKKGWRKIKLWLPLEETEGVAACEKKNKDGHFMVAILKHGKSSKGLWFLCAFVNKEGTHAFHDNTGFIISGEDRLSNIQWFK